MFERMGSMIRKEFIQFFRDIPLVLIVLYMFVEVAVCGWALTMDYKNVSIAVMDMDKTEKSQELINQFRQSDKFQVTAYPMEEGELAELLDKGTVKMGVVIPANFSESLTRGEGATVQLVADGENSTMAAQAIGNSMEVIGTYSAEWINKKMGFDVLDQIPLKNIVRIHFASDLNYTHFVMISMVSITVVLLGILMAAAVFIREKESGTLEQLMVTPIRPGELIFAKMLPMSVIKMVGLTIGVSMSFVFFDVPIRGSLLLFYVLSLLVFISSSGLGIYIATVANTMQQALLLSFFVLFPLMFLSGTLVPVENMSPVMQWLSYFSPLRYYTNISMGIFLKGVGISVLWPDVLALVIIGGFLFFISLRRLKKQLA
ncbi:ABC transporter permease [Microaerobacter geothermalis]|uniref:ABC transporter permease n=1 Tax=Microaerobacter geothermalis TaxID=674972 RepID=UPI001F1E2C1D|nr:ABC transporter permease [Microaerobacter geothermalis]MCF6093441.1 ABC transporter permease [Microaerobacter geothermalis]